MLRSLAAVVLAAAVLLLLPGAASARGCKGADVVPTRAETRVVQDALVCLHNRARRAHGLPRLRRGPRLRRAARSYASRMVRGAFFSHVAPSGTRVAQRVRRTGYARGRSLFGGENLGWGAASQATARQRFRAWMASPAHRVNILERRFRVVGVGVALGAPGSPGSGAATFSIVFATP
jgi:uncharacterized protein YkwD